MDFFRVEQKDMDTLKKNASNRKGETNQGQRRECVERSGQEVRVEAVGDGKRKLTEETENFSLYTLGRMKCERDSALALICVRPRLEIMSRLNRRIN